MIEYIAHRINTIVELEQLPIEYGVELDLRDNVDGTIYIQHNPFEIGENFESYMEKFSSRMQKGILILNVKSERIELKIIELLKRYSIKKYFFLDSTFPMIFSLSLHNEKNIALRYSEFEGMDTIRNMRGNVDWVWVDCFTRFPLNKKIEVELHEMGYKLCLVSPELEGRESDIEIYKNQIKKEGILFDAVCTKSYNIKRWKERE